MNILFNLLLTMAIGVSAFGQLSSVNFNFPQPITEQTLPGGFFCLDSIVKYKEIPTYAKHYQMVIMSPELGHPAIRATFDLNEIVNPSMPIYWQTATTSPYGGFWINQCDSTGCLYNQIIRGSNGQNDYHTIIMDTDMQRIDTMRSEDSHIGAVRLANGNVLTTGSVTKILPSGTDAEVQTIEEWAPDEDSLVASWSPFDTTYGLPNLELISKVDSFTDPIGGSQYHKDLFHSNCLARSDSSIWFGGRYIGFCEIKKDATGNYYLNSIMGTFDRTDDDYTFKGDSLLNSGAHGLRWDDPNGDTLVGMWFNNGNLSTPRKTELVRAMLIQSQKVVWIRKTTLPGDSYAWAMGNAWPVVTTNNKTDYELWEETTLISFNAGGAALPYDNIPGYPYPHNGLMSITGELYFTISMISAKHDHTRNYSYQTSATYLPWLEAIMPVVECSLIGNDSIKLSVSNSQLFSDPTVWIDGNVGFEIIVKKPADSTFYVGKTRTPAMTPNDNLLCSYKYIPGGECNTIVIPNNLSQIENVNFMLYPNPVFLGDDLNIDFERNKTEVKTVELFNSLGKKMDVVWTNNKIKTGNLTTGMYLIIVNQTNQLKVIIVD